LFDVAGNLNFYSAQLWIERNRALYGDNLTVLANALDEGACFGFYRAPQIKSDEGEGWSSGVKTDRHGKAVAYSLSDYTNPGQFVEIRREDAILYRHNPDARGLRGVTDLRRAIRHIHDETEIVAFSKQSAKLAATIGIIETKNVEDKRPGMGAGLVGKTEITDDGRKVEAVIGGTKVVRLDPGRDLKILNDPRPSPNVMALVRHLMDEVAYGIGLTPSILWDPDKVGSAGIRYVMQRLKRWLKLKYVYRQQWCNRVCVAHLMISG
ncbi:MAG: phage portal protein, partial [Akkermansia sp.]